ncbi:MAG: MazG nucleotide pyrophosphohydrolase domain-containing protein [Candidatus Bruticola sp.]
MNKVHFPNTPSLPLLQSYIKNKCEERGFTKASNLEVYLLLTEEIGELAKAIRKKSALFEEVLSTSPNPTELDKEKILQENLAEEMADVLSYLLDLANRFNVDLATALKSKEEKNDHRQWR